MPRVSKIENNRVGPRSKKPIAKRTVLITPKRTLKNGKVSKGQMRAATLISTLLEGTPYEMEVTWDWLKGPAKTNLYVDIYFPKYRLAVEYHGEQHFKFPNFFHKTKKLFTEGKKRDRIKRGLLQNQGIKFIEWRFDETFTDARAIKKLINVGLENKISSLGPSHIQTPTRQANRVSKVRSKSK